jgi:hypothetical protein
MRVWTASTSSSHFNFIFWSRPYRELAFSPIACAWKHAAWPTLGRVPLRHHHPDPIRAWTRAETPVHACARACPSRRGLSPLFSFFTWGWRCDARGASMSIQKQQQGGKSCMHLEPKKRRMSLRISSFWLQKMYLSPVTGDGPSSPVGGSR